MISVLLPTYNAAETIELSIRSILRQTNAEYELLVMDDGSTDETASIVSRLNDSRIQYHKLPHQGLTKTLNEGLSIARYDIIARMDADDLCVPWRFEKQLAVLNQLPKNTILSSWYGMFSDGALQYLVEQPISSNEIKKGLLLHSFLSHPGLMCFKDTIVKNGGYRTNVEIDAFQDYETWLAIKDNVEFHIIPEVLVFQRFRKESLSNNVTYKQQVMYSIQEPYYVDLYSHFGISDKREEDLYRGWREYFYGDKSKARTYWRKLGLTLVRQPRVMVAWFVTLLPENMFLCFKEYRLKFRLLYFVRYLLKINIRLRKQFALLIRSIDL
jgi:glycosyltransferase involved in cell wall biosynthesis